MDISVIICTYNRCESLRRTLTTLCAVAVPENTQWELLVLDNNSTDGTTAICDEFAAKLPLRRILESRQGKSHALNHGIAEAQGQFLIFTDDDVDLDPQWLVSHRDASKRNPTAVFFGGKVIPRWERPPPAWLEQNSATLLRAMTVHWDMGDTERTLVDPGEGFLGANLAFRAQVFKTGIQFRPDLGPTKYDPTRGEDAELIERIRAAGAIGVYVPTAIVYHRNGAERMTEKYLREWHRGSGVSESRIRTLSKEQLWFSVPRYFWKQLIVETAKYALFRWTAPSAVWIRSEILMARSWGIILECRRQAHQSKP